MIDRLATVRERIHSDFLMPSRLGEYERLLRTALDAGYDIQSVERYRAGSMATGPAADRPILILRHDIDTDVGTARDQWAIDHRLGVRSSHFFRLSTLDLDLMRTIAEAGADASYHYEELATVARRRRPRTREAAEALIPEARERFARNLQRLRELTGLPMQVVASHGDFLNRKIGINNWAILADPSFRASMGILLETYDQGFLDTVSSYHRDAPPPTCWMHADPFESIAAREPVMYVLIHPRPWQVNRRVNLRDDVARLRDGLSYRLRRPGPA